MELIRDIANELDIDLLCHKILLNVQLLTNADRGSLFLVRETENKKHLVAKLFDVRQDTEFNEAILDTRNEYVEIPFGVGIAGVVAETKKMINIKNAYEVSVTTYWSDLRDEMKLYPEQSINFEKSILLIIPGKCNLTLYLLYDRKIIS